MEMTKWFDTNYHYIVPEFTEGTTFRLASTKPVDEFNEAKELGIHTRPVLLGPVSFLLLGKARQEGLNPLDLLDGLLAVYEQVLRQLAEAGADWVQIDEPCLAGDLAEDARGAFGRAYQRLADASDRLKLLVATYFCDLRENLPVAASLPVDALHVDLVRGAGSLPAVLEAIPPSMTLSMGVVDGRNIWKTDLGAAGKLVSQAIDALGSDRVMIAPSCSLLHSPVDLSAETDLDEELRSWLAFAAQKVEELALLAQSLRPDAEDTVTEALAANAKALADRKASPRIHRPEVKQRADDVDESMLRRHSPFALRRDAQHEALKLPLLPTTTIGSFPQTREVRANRAAFKKGNISRTDYEDFCRAEIERTVRLQEKLGLDVLVHGESERNDMVEYFGEQLEGFAHTANGWVQSYGSRCVKPPIIYGDVLRPEPMTVEWSHYAQSLTDKPMKGMLTGPITILQWSFVRDDQPRSETCRQIALAIRDEVTDLEKAGIGVIQIDEPALKEGQPLRAADGPDYLRWAVDCFRLSASGVKDATQIHTHMCYAEFNDIIEAIAELDADVISIESSRSQMDLLDAFADFQYPNEVGPGVYDIHSPRIPATAEMVALLEKAADVLPVEKLWVNPDCGLKTRRWDQVEPALKNMVEAAEEMRSRVPQA
jgi:5-methyltetrahydropteroyltriglutamate--homocysteine methyltransferase